MLKKLTPNLMVEDVNYEFHPLTLDRWQDFETLFGPRGACGGCWCMWYRLTNAQREALKGEGNRRSMHAIVTSGEVPGLLAYAITGLESEKKPVQFIQSSKGYTLSNRTDKN